MPVIALYVKAGSARAKGAMHDVLCPTILDSRTLNIDKRESNFGLLDQMPSEAGFRQDSHPI